MEETHTAACRSRELGCRGLPRSEHRTGHSGGEEEHRAALGSVGVAIGDHGGDALSTEVVWCLCCSSSAGKSTIGKNRQLVTNEPVEFEK